MGKKSDRKVEMQFLQGKESVKWEKTSASRVWRSAGTPLEASMGL